jgi:hypothetical protein
MFSQVGLAYDAGWIDGQTTVLLLLLLLLLLNHLLNRFS